MTNFLAETQKAIEESDHTIAEITYIGTYCGDKALNSWSEFQTMADFEYDNGYGKAEINTGLVIKFSDNTWIERYEYDGSEKWIYSYVPQRKPNASKLKSFHEIDQYA
jgi:hypothetical protein